MKTQVHTKMFNAVFSGNPQVAGIKKPKSLSSIQAVFAIDATGSGLQFADATTKIQSQIAIELPKHVKELRCGQYLLRDSDYDPADAALVLNLKDGTPNELITAAQLITFEGGGDDDETFKDGIVHFFDHYPLDFNAGTRRVYVMTASSNSKPPKNGMTDDQLAQLFIDHGVLFIVIATPGSNMHDLAKKAGGLSFTLDTTPSVADVDQVIKRLAASMTNATIDPTKIASMAGQAGQNGTQFISS